MGSWSDSGPASRFSSLQPAPLDGVFALDAAYRKDAHEPKVNLGIGAYRDDEGQPWQLGAVKKARSKMAADVWLHEYLPLHGDDAFLEASKKLLFGPKIPATAIASVQTVSGTGANSVVARLAGQYLAPSQVWFPDPTWDNHYKIWEDNAPNARQRRYPYFDASSRRFDLEGMLTTLRRDALAGDAILLHACAHNPTGLDPTQEQWKQIAQVCLEKKLFVIFDVAYQGFASGDLDRDAWAVRYFCSFPELELAACQSFSKNLGLYGERAGALHVVPSRATADPVVVMGVRSTLVDIQRGTISMAPRFGSQVASMVMGSDELLKLWKEDLLRMSRRIIGMRQALYEELLRLGTPGDWRHIVEQCGMFSFTGLSPEQVETMQKDYHVYMLPSGRMSVCGLTSTNVHYVAASMDATVRRGLSA
ncbi:aspartate aminotransferase [Plectosphaerella plurivora]|uniref:Aspartate aminotransferase n=1 Tax=Plectosphaerella plurivora TaxID=936078 RepID=A0A9P8V718_9PEZI|nr:aspartate aminotransferase [Plectosphaerella plurivora]